MSTESNKAIIRDVYGALNRGNDEAAFQRYAPDFICHMPGLPEPVRGIEANKAMLAGFRAGFSDIRYDEQAMIAEGDKVAVRWRWSLKHTGDFQGLSPSGREIAGTTMEFFRIENGQIMEQWTESDNLSFMQQVGALPTMEGAESGGL
ncbi:MAG: ester cyclase [Ardenticatenaceae bacterium]